LIVEDEVPAGGKTGALPAEIQRWYFSVAKLQSVKETVGWLGVNQMKLIYF